MNLLQLLFLVPSSIRLGPLDTFGEVVVDVPVLERPLSELRFHKAVEASASNESSDVRRTIYMIVKIG